MALPAIAIADRAGPLTGATKRLGEERGLISAKNNEGVEEKKEKSSIFSPRGFILISIGLLLDFLCIICVILVLAFGVGILLAKIVYVVGTVFFAVLSMFNKEEDPLLRFFKKQWKKLAVKAIPVVGDAIPIWTITALSML